MFSQKKIQTTYWMVILIVALCALGLGYRATARSVDSRPPTVVVVFNLQQVFDNFVDRAILGAGYKELEVKVEIERKRREEHVQSLIAAYEELVTKTRMPLFDQIQQAVGEAESMSNLLTEKKILRSRLFCNLCSKTLKTQLLRSRLQTTMTLLLQVTKGWN